MLNISQGDDELVKGEIIELDNEYVQLENENVPIENNNAEIDNFENESFEDEMLPSHNPNCIIDHVEHDNAQESNAQEPYISPNYNRNEGSRTLKWIIEIDETIITSLEGKKSERTIQLWARRLYNMFFGNKTVVEQCYLFMHLLKMQKMRPILSKLKIRVNKKLERNAIIVKNLFSALNSIGKNSREKDNKATRRVITTSLVSHHLRKGRYMRQTCIDLNINHTTLRRALSRREKIDDPLQNEIWAFGGRLPRIDKKLSDDVKEDITQF